MLDEPELEAVDVPVDESLFLAGSLAVLDPQGRLTGFIQPPFEPKDIAADMTALSEATK